MKNLEKRIIAARGDGLIRFLDDAWGRTEGFSPSECVLERSIAKSSTRVVMLIVAALSIAVCPVLIVSIEQGVPSSWLGRVIIGVLVLVCSVFLSWSLCWPFPGRQLCWRTAVDFADAIGYAEKATGLPFERWCLDDASVETAVEKALVSELEAICAIQEKDHIKAGNLYAKWQRRHSQMQRLFPSIKGYYELTTPATFLPYDQEADPSVHYCSRS